MKVTSFTPLGDLIIVEAMVWGPRGRSKLNLALDTGSAHTLILPEIMDELGFNPRDGMAITGVYSAIGKEQGYLMKVPRFVPPGAAPGSRLHPHRLPDPRLRPRRPLRDRRPARAQLPALAQLHGPLGRGADPRRGNRHLARLGQVTVAARPRSTT